MSTFLFVIVHTIEVNGNQNYFVTNIDQIILFCALDKKINHVGLEQN